MPRGRTPGTRNIGAGAYCVSLSRAEAEALTFYACAYPTEEMSDPEFKAFGSALDKVQKAIMRRDAVNARKLRGETNGETNEREEGEEGATE